MCAPFALFEGLKVSCQPENEESHKLSLLQRALASAAVDARTSARANQHNGRKKWHWCNLSFSDNTLEQAFRMYYADLRSNRMRAGMLTFCSFYIVYALIVWSSDALKAELYLRVAYLCFLLLAFVGSFSSTWQSWSQLGAWFVATATLIEVGGEAIILNHFLSVNTLVIICLFMLAWNVFVRFRFVYTVLLCTTVGVSYFVVAVIFFRNGDRSVKSDNVGVAITWNTSIILGFSLFISKLSHRQEVSSRYNFLSNMHRASTSMLYDRTGSSQPVTPTFDRDLNLRNRRERAATKTSNSPRKAIASVRKHLAGSPLDGPSSNPPALPDNLPTLRDITFNESIETKDRTMSSQSYSEDFTNLMGEARDGASAIFDRMTTTAGRSMSRIGTFSESALKGTDKDTVFGYFFGDIDTTYTTSSTGIPSPLFNGRGENRENRGEQRNASNATDGLHASLLANDGNSNTNTNTNTAILPSSTNHHNQRTSNLEEPVLLSEPCLCNSDQLPKWFEPYSYTLTGYRLHYNDRLSCNSILQCHNETQNIWTEFLPLMVFIFIAVWMLEDWNVVLAAPPLDHFFILLAIFGCLIIRPLVSGMAHVFYQQSRNNYLLWWSLDYVSICCAITCSSLLFARYTFYCECDRQLFYIIGVIGLLTSTIIAVTSAASPGVRVTSFILLIVIANGLPLFFQLYINIFDTENESVLPWEFMNAWMASLGIMLFGLITRSCSIPEVCCPGCFDYIGHSHGWWHLAVNGGFAMMLVGIHKYLSFRSQHVCDSVTIDWCNNGTFSFHNNQSVLL